MIDFVADRVSYRDWPIVASTNDLRFRPGSASSRVLLPHIVKCRSSTFASHASDTPTTLEDGRDSDKGRQKHVLNTD